MKNAGLKIETIWNPFWNLTSRLCAVLKRCDSESLGRVLLAIRPVYLLISKLKISPANEVCYTAP